MRRHKPLLYWLFGKKNNVNLFELIRFTFGFSFEYLGKKKLKSLTLEKDFFKADFVGFRNPIFWPKKFPISSLFQVAAELLYINWWNYEIPENPINPTDVVLDCGAAEGAFSLYIANRCKKVYAIEPHALFVKAMEKTFQGINNIEVLPIGVGESKGHLKLSNDGIMSQINISDGVEVELDTIDNLFFHKNIEVNYIKADLEGFEISMLRGAEKTIAKWKPKLSITTYHYQEDWENTFSYLKKICPEYTIKGIGITDKFGTPIMLHAWIN